MLYFTADLHFNHNNIIDYCRRPYPDVRMMNTELVLNWNAKVGPKDTVYVIGDFAFGKADQIKPIFKELHGHKHLILGNHDLKNKAVLELPWESQEHLTTLRWEGQHFVLCHYPIESWPYAHRGFLHLHGHCHGSLRRVIPHRFDVGVDVWSYAPISAEEIIDKADQQDFTPVDHHA